MAFENYEELESTVARWLDRDDLADDIKDFIYLAELRVRQELEIGDQDKRVGGVLISGQDFLTLPADCIVPKLLRLDTSPIRTLSVVTPEKFATVKQNAAGSYPRAICVVGNRLCIAPAPTAADAYTLDYVSGIPFLKDIATENLIKDSGFWSSSLDDWYSPDVGNLVWTAANYPTDTPVTAACTNPLAQNGQLGANSSAITSAIGHIPSYGAEDFNVSCQMKAETGALPGAFINFHLVYYTHDGKWVEDLYGPTGVAYASRTDFDLTDAWAPYTSTFKATARARYAMENGGYAVPFIIILSGVADCLISIDDFQCFQTNVSNELLRDFPNLLLYGALLESAPFLGADPRLATWDGLFTRAREFAKRQQWRARTGGGPLQIRPDVVA